MDIRELVVAKTYFTSREVQGFTPSNEQVKVAERTMLTYLGEVEDDVRGYRRFSYLVGDTTHLIDLRPGAVLTLSTT